ncbi:hypothetical protein ACXR2U_17910 [Jatrophihabitans sp. YIM 134969]
MPRTTNRFVKVTVTAGALLAVTGLTGASAFAATTYKVTAGTKTSGQQDYTAATKTGTTDAPGIYFKDKTSGLELGCTKGTAAGAANLGASVAGAGLASISSTTWTSCAGPGGIPLTPTQNGTWNLNAKGKTNSSGVTKGSISNVNATVSGPGCTFTVSGAVDGSYTNSTGALKVATVAGTGNVLKVSAVTGCFSQINNGDIVIFKATYKVTTSSGLLKIKSNA